MIYQNFLAKELKNRSLTFTVNPWATFDKKNCSDYELANLPSMFAIDEDVARQQPVLRLLGAKTKFVKSPYEKDNLQINFTKLNPNFIPLGLATGIVNDYQLKGEVFADVKNHKEFQSVLNTMLNVYHHHTELKDKFNNRSLSRSKKIYIFEDGSACSQGSLAKVFHVSDALIIFRFLDAFIFKMRTIYDKPEWETLFLNEVSEALCAKEGIRNFKAPENINQALTNKEFKQALDELTKNNNWDCKNSQKGYARVTQRNIYKGLGLSEENIKGDANFKKLIKEKFIETCDKGSNLNPNFCATQFDKVFEKVELKPSETQLPNTSKLMCISMAYLNSNSDNKKVSKFLSDVLIQVLERTFDYKVRIVKGINVLRDKLEQTFDMATLDRNEIMNEIESLTTKAKNE